MKTIECIGHQGMMCSPFSSLYVLSSYLGLSSTLRPLQCSTSDWVRMHEASLRLRNSSIIPEVCDSGVTFPDCNHVGNWSYNILLSHACFVSRTLLHWISLWSRTFPVAAHQWWSSLMLALLSVGMWKIWLPSERSVTDTKFGCMSKGKCWLSFLVIVVDYVSVCRHGLSSLCLPAEEEAVAVCLSLSLSLFSLFVSSSLPPISFLVMFVSISICHPFLPQLSRDADSLVLSPGTWFGLLSCPYLVS